MAQSSTIINTIRVEGSQRIEPETVRSYMLVAPGDVYDPAIVDQSLKRLFATGLFADITIRLEGQTVIVSLRENPIINRIAFEGNDKLDNAELGEEMKLRPRVVFTRAKVQADVQRLVELYRRSGRFAATVEPKIVELPQNRVNLIFEISEGEKTTIQRINIIGNEDYSDKDLRGEIATKEARWWRFMTSNDTYDPDRLLYDRELLRQYYLQQGYADFHVISAVAELSRDRKDFFITITLEEGEIYTVGEIGVESQIPDLEVEDLRKLVYTREGKRYNAKQIEFTIDAMTDAAGLLGYAFVNVRPRIKRDRENQIINITYVVMDAPRVYIERIDIVGNVRTLDKVIRREMRIVEGDAFNTARIRRSQDRIRSLGFFEEVEVDQVEGSTPDRVIVTATVQERSTGELSIGAGVSSRENVIGEISIRERNLLGKGQDLRLALAISSRRQQIDIGFTEPYFLNRNIAAGVDLFHRRVDYDESSFEQASTGANLRAVFPIIEYLTMGLRYQIRQDDVQILGLAPSPFITVGKFLTSSVGYTLNYDTRDDYRKPTRGFLATLSQDFAGLGGQKYIRSRLNYDWYTPLPFLTNWVFNFSVEAGHIFGYGGDVVNINDRFFLGGSRLRGFEQAGVGPRYIPAPHPSTPEDEIFYSSSLGGNTFLAGSLEIFIPLGAIEEFGISASTFVDFGIVYGVDETADLHRENISRSGGLRMSVGIGFSWRSPFGPIRFDFAKAIMKEPFDETEFFQFNVGTRF
ncbi:MAG: outer membrane protein assembly factor BamA [Alphaproteobacteria bacterium]|nr:MAG: outer membrane protein assembly factor BamA [Alphaproteobacteria bacterium]